MRQWDIGPRLSGHLTVWTWVAVIIYGIEKWA